MNTECYTTEYRQCLSPKGQLYLKADSEGKPYLTFNHHFRQEPCIIMPYVSHTHTHTRLTHAQSWISQTSRHICHVYTDCIMLHLNPIRVPPLTLLYTRSCHCLLACFFAFRFQLRNGCEPLVSRELEIFNGITLARSIKPLRVQVERMLLENENNLHFGFLRTVHTLSHCFACSLRY